eukprot:COSAG06_NODE_40395_length_402_cov_1.000000_1_plen_60_part_10
METLHYTPGYYYGRAPRQHAAAWRKRRDAAVRAPSTTPSNHPHSPRKAHAPPPPPPPPPP